MPVGHGDLVSWSLLFRLVVLWRLSYGFRFDGKEGTVLSDPCGHLGARAFGLHPPVSD